MPRWRNRDTRMSQKHDFPGSNPGWGTRFRRKRRAFVPLRHSDRKKRIVLLQLGMWPVPGRHSSTAERDVASVEMRVRFSLPAPTNGFPSSNDQDGGLSIRKCRFKSGRELHLARPTHTPVAQPIRARGHGPRGRGFKSFLGCHDAVTQRPECSPVEREAAGSTPASVANFSRRVA